MSATGQVRRLMPPDIRARKGAQPIVCLTAYTTPVARLADAHCDVVLVGDSVGMVLHGLPSTLGVTLDMMILHAKAVRRGLTQALMVVDLPFGTYEASPEQAFATAARVMAETDCAAVKLEGGVAMADTIAFLSARGIPVMAHVGLTPQAVNALGGYSVQGRGEDGARVLADARAVAEAGAFAVVLEKIAAPLAQRITEAIAVPTIGIGASSACDGQILVVDDMLGLFGDFRPRFVKRYAELARDAETAIAAYASDVRASRFPATEHAFADAPAAQPQPAAAPEMPQETAPPKAPRKALGKLVEKVVDKARKKAQKKARKQEQVEAPSKAELKATKKEKLKEHGAAL